MIDDADTAPVQLEANTPWTARREIARRWPGRFVTFYGYDWQGNKVYASTAGAAEKFNPVVITSQREDADVSPEIFEALVGIDLA